MAFLTKPKELKNLNDSIKRIADLFNYFSDMAKDFKQNPFMKSIQSEYFYREQEIKIEKEHKQKAQEYLEDSQRRKELLSKRIEADENDDITKINSVIKKKQKNITLKKPKNRHKSLMNHLKTSRSEQRLRNVALNRSILRF